MTPLKEQFLRFHRDNPDVMKELMRLALDLKSSGVNRYGLSALWEVMRYNFSIQHPGAVAKFPNNHRAYYARALMLIEPSLSGFFETCTLRSGEREVTLEDLMGGSEAK